MNTQDTKVGSKTSIVVPIVTMIGAVGLFGVVALMALNIDNGDNGGSVPIPTVAFVAPDPLKAPQPISGLSTVIVTAQPQVTRVQLWKGTTLVGTDNACETDDAGNCTIFTFTFNTWPFTNATANIEARAYNGGTGYGSGFEKVTINNTPQDTAAPTAVITGPVAGIPYSGVVPFTVETTDDASGVQKVSIINTLDKVLGSSTTSSACTVNTAANCRKFTVAVDMTSYQPPKGGSVSTYSIGATAWDWAGRSGNAPMVDFKLKPRTY